MFDSGEVRGCVLGSDAAFVIAKGHVDHPVETVLDGSVASHGRPKLFGWELQ